VPRGLARRARHAAAAMKAVSACAWRFRFLRRGPPPVTVKENGITYLSGGFDPEDALAMQAQARNYSLRLVFSVGERKTTLPTCEGDDQGHGRQGAAR
jgi:hypothetical protein